ncbi:MAG: hypothetical protein R3178_05310 [Rhodothermales bacterium]|nr:hypothetical protein [Rhodothermales bacterium]
MQVIYAFIAILLIALLSLTLQRSVHSTERRQIVNEVSTQLVGVGIDVLEDIGRHAFDYEVDTTRADFPLWRDDFPYATNPAQLTPIASAEFGNCVDFYSCDDIDDFHNMTITRVVDGVGFNVDIFVEYVSETTPNVKPGTQTFAKEVRLEISSSALYLSSPANPLTVEISRVFAYDQPTQP